MHSDNWDDLRYVLAVAEEGSVAAASRRLGVNHATVLRRVAAFEERHGVAVFEKDARGYRVPPDRLALIEAAREVEAAMAGVDRAVSGRTGGAEGHVRITSTDTFTSGVLPEILAEIGANAPGLRFELLSSNRHLDFARLQADITVRPAQVLPPDLAGERAGTLGLGVYAAEGGADAWIGLGGLIAGTPPGRWMAANVPADQIGDATDSFQSARALAGAGRGRAVLPCLVGDADPRLSRLDIDLDGIEVPVWVASHADLADAPRLKRLRSRIVAALEARADMLTGRGVRSA